MHKFWIKETSNHINITVFLVNRIKANLAICFGGEGKVKCTNEGLMKPLLSLYPL